MSRESEKLSTPPSPLSATGGIANEATTFYKRLASCLAMKWDYPYSSTMSWLRCRLTFFLLRSAIQCIRGARSSCGHAMCLNYLTHFNSVPCPYNVSIFIPFGTILSFLTCHCTMCIIVYICIL